jgi:ABC-type transport system substrate-binding protein
VAASPTAGGNLTGAFLQDATTLHPYLPNTATGTQYINLLFDATLTKRDPPTLAVLPNAAASWSIDASQKTVTFKLKAGLMWSDGQALTANDYVWTYQQVSQRENKWPLASSSFYYADTPGSQGVSAMSAPDATTLQVTLNLPQWTFDADILSRADIIQPLPQHVWQGKNWSDPNTNPEILTPSVVSGPWRLKEWRPGDHITFVRNASPTLSPAPHLDSLTFKIVRDDLTALQGLRTKTLDFYQPAAVNEAAFAQTSTLTTYRWTPGNPNWYYLGFNFRRPYFLDQALRQALAFATDRQAIIDKAASGLGAPIYSSVPPWSRLFSNAGIKYDFKPDQVRQILQEAGYLSKDGQLLTKDGQPFPTLKLALVAPNPLYEQAAAILKQDWATLGISLEVKTFDAAGFNKFLADPNSDYDLYLSGWQSDFDSGNFGVAWGANLDLNPGAYHNQALLDLYAQAQQENDATKRQALLFQIQATENKDLPYIFLFAEFGWTTVGPRVQGISPSNLGLNANRYTDWYVSQ